ncbi:helicase-primase primase subunit [Rhinolophus gammaherpesvirus 1]|uniref:Helicase-primase primase subunit n=1 Tax=Rhinolophus gammaherpesvirus 1 TaxID=2054179 RepID=A0A2Z5U661_9GAMA|nr:helicase-primase primase subunit [Rhinolophus gammaherpesvirus 1]BBB06508.1 helicase-primase primase subunit [Rhinolophus gammaherpesvirus 1]
MSTEASEIPSQGAEISHYKVVFGTDGDTAEILTDILTNTDNKSSVFCLIHNCYSYNINRGDVLITLYMPTKRPGGAEKCLPVMQFKSDASTATGFLFHGKPVSVKYIQSNLDLRAVKKFFRPILSVLNCTNNQSDRPHVDLRSTIYWFRAKFVVAMRKMFKITTSPFWMISAFGSFEIPFILVSSCYFFESHDCTIDTLSHLARLFESHRGKSLTSINTFSDLSGMFGTSAWLNLVPKFSDYVSKKLARDDLESQAIDIAVNTFRGQLMLSNPDLIHYIYLSFFQCLNRENFLLYSRQTDPEHIDSIQPDPILTRSIDDSFKNKMKTYYTKHTYLATHISVSLLNLPALEGYSHEVVSPLPSIVGRDPLQFWFRQSRELQKFLTELQEEFPCLRISSDLQGLLDLASLDPEQQDNDSIKGKLFSDPPLRTPVFRCQYLNKTFFCVVNRDNLTTKWADSVVRPYVTDWSKLTDKQITSSICYKEAMFSMHQIREQMEVSRHEYFNPRLPVFNLVLDFDLPLNKAGLSLDYIYSICLSIREDVISALKLLDKNVDQAQHPVYFFKSACPPLEWIADGEPRPFCNCFEKLGMRVISPMPPGVAIIGGKPLVSLTKILNRLIKMNKDVFAICPNILEIDGPFDSGIYHKGRCVRLPHTYKVNETGGLERLLKLIVCHPHVADKAEYVSGATALSNLLYHSKSSFWENGLKLPTEKNSRLLFRAIYDITDVSENFLQHQAQLHLPKSYEEVDNRIETMTGIDLLNWITEVAWPKIFHNIKVYLPDDKATQFHFVKFTQTSHNIIQLKPQRGNSFQCLTLNHRSKTQNVRIFIVLYTNKEDQVTSTLMSQCFANKCNNNKPRAHFSIAIPLKREEL